MFISYNFYFTLLFPVLLLESQHFHLLLLVFSYRLRRSCVATSCSSAASLCCVSSSSLKHRKQKSASVLSSVTFVFPDDGRHEVPPLQLQELRFRGAAASLLRRSRRTVPFLSALQGYFRKRKNKETY